MLPQHFPVIYFRSGVGYNLPVSANRPVARAVSPHTMLPDTEHTHSSQQQTVMQKICVYCGSSPGKSAAYIEAARQLADELVKRKIDLVYGGANIGIMGELANTVLAAGGKVIGVIPKSLLAKEISHPGLTTLHVVDSMHERKALMEHLSDGFIALPGGLGTIEELFEVLTWAQLGFHSKPCALYNVEGFYQSLTHFLDHAVEAQFIKPAHRDMLLVEENPAALLGAMAEYEPPRVDKLIGHREL